MISSVHCEDFYRNKPTILYYVKVNRLYKVGVTLYDKRRNISSNILKKRFRSSIKKGFDIEVLETKIYNNGEQAYLQEQVLCVGDPEGRNSQEQPSCL